MQLITESAHQNVAETAQWIPHTKGAYSEQ